MAALLRLADAGNRGVPVPMVADWIGDKLQTYKDTYHDPNPEPEDIAQATLAGYEGKQTTE